MNPAQKITKEFAIDLAMLSCLIILSNFNGCVSAKTLVGNITVACGDVNL